MSVTGTGILSKHSTVFDLERDIIRVIRPLRRHGEPSKKGGLWVEVIPELQCRMDERDIAVGALRMIAGEADPPPGIKGSKTIARDALKCISKVGRKP